MKKISTERATSSGNSSATWVIWKTLLIAEQHFRMLNAPELCTSVYEGVVYRDGICTVNPTRELLAA